MNRRGFLANLIAGAVAVLGAGMAAQPAEASEAADREADVYERGRAIAEARAESRADLGLPIKRDDTALIRGYIERGEAIPAGRYHVSQTMDFSDYNAAKSCKRITVTAPRRDDHDDGYAWAEY